MKGGGEGWHRARLGRAQALAHQQQLVRGVVLVGHIDAKRFRELERRASVGGRRALLDGGFGARHLDGAPQLAHRGRAPRVHAARARAHTMLGLRDRCKIVPLILTNSRH